MMLLLLNVDLKIFTHAFIRFERIRQQDIWIIKCLYLFQIIAIFKEMFYWSIEFTQFCITLSAVLFSNDMVSRKKIKASLRDKKTPLIDQFFLKSYLIERKISQLLCTYYSRFRSAIHKI